ncbi:Secreted protein, with PKD repeat domain [Halomicrobium sp. LC1Hm]|nr:Secreted protein, with PKD repeat domain [Halomicrobium sp. LC1Hm]
MGATFILAMMVMTAPVAAATTLFSTGFESGFPSEFTHTEPESDRNFSVQSNTVISGSNTLEFSNPDSGFENDGFHYSLSSPTDSIDISQKYQTTGDTEFIVNLYDDSGSSFTHKVKFDTETDEIVVENNSGTTLGSTSYSFQNGTTYDLNVVYESGDIVANVDGTQEVSTGVVSYSGIEEVGYTHNTVNQGTNSYLDDMSVSTVGSTTSTGDIEVSVSDAGGSGSPVADTTVDLEDSGGTVVATKTVSSSDADNKVTFSGYTAGETYTVRASHPDYDNASKTVTNTENTTDSVSFDMARTMGTIEVSEVTDTSATAIDYPNIDVYRANDGSSVTSIDGAILPYTADVWIAYDYDVTVDGYNEGVYHPKTKTYTVSDGSTTSKSYTLAEMPNADFQDSDNASTVEEGTSVTIDASASSDPEGDTLTYSWDTNNDGTFGDESGGSSITVSESSAGTYEYTVKVSDNNGGTDTATYTLTVEEPNSAPTADFQDSDNAETITVDGSLTLDASASSDPDGDSLTYSWDTNNDGTYGDESGGSSISVSESSSGTYNYSVKVSDGNGSTDTATFTLTVEEPATGTLEITGVTDSDGNSLSSFDYTITRVSDGTQVASGTGASAPVSNTLATGDYDVTVNKDMYNSQNLTLTVTENSTTSQSFTIDKKMKSFNIVVEDVDGNQLDSFDYTVSEDGTDIVAGTSSYGNDVKLADIEYGTYTFEVTSDGYESASKSATVDDQKDQVVFTLSESTSSDDTSDGSGGGGSGSNTTNNHLLVIGVFVLVFLIILLFLAIRNREE